MTKWKKGDRVQLKANSIRGAQRPIGSTGTVLETFVDGMEGFVLVDWDKELRYDDSDVHQNEIEPERTTEPKYTREKVQEAVKRHESRLFSHYSTGRSPTWSCDQRTKDVWCIGLWLDEELTRLNVGDKVRRLQTSEFNRYSRSDEDLYGIAAEALNAAVEGRVDLERTPHRRWG